MEPRKFLPYLYLMRSAYYHSATEAVGEWKRSRTDDIMIIEDDESLTLVTLGTQAKIIEWLWNLAFRSEEWFNIGRVHRGFARNVHELYGREDEKGSLLNRCLAASNKGKHITLAGHSGGYPKSCLAATFLMAHGVNGSLIKVVGCGGARVGDSRFGATYHKILGARTFVLNATSDPVRFLPPWGSSNGKETKINSGYMPKHVIDKYIKLVEAF